MSGPVRGPSRAASQVFRTQPEPSQPVANLLETVMLRRLSGCAGLVSLLALGMSSPVLAAGANAYRQTILVANDAKYQPTALVDPNLVNPWGIALRPPGAGGHFWTSNAGTGTTTTYIGDVPGLPLYQDGLKVVPIVTSAYDRMPFETGADGIAQVTGQVYNAASDYVGQPAEFHVSGPAINYSNGSAYGTDSGAAKFIFVTQDGTINAWRTKTDPGMLEAVVIKDYSQSASIVPGTQIPGQRRPGFNGVAITTDRWTTDASGNKVADNRLYVADFANGHILTFDNQWNDISERTPFARPADLSETWMPFNVQVLGDGRVYVAWTENSLEIDEPTEEVAGPGLGRIVAYDRDGTLLQDYREHALLNNPWGMVIAPEDFGAFGGDLLVANFGDGTVVAYDRQTGEEKGYLRDEAGEIIVIDGIWGLTFGNGVHLGQANHLYFTAGPDEERDGLFGKLELASAPVPEPSRYAMLLAGLGLVGVALRRRVH